MNRETHILEETFGKSGWNVQSPADGWEKHHLSQHWQMKSTLLSLELTRKHCSVYLKFKLRHQFLKLAMLKAKVT